MRRTLVLSILAIAPSLASAQTTRADRVEKTGDAPAAVAADTQGIVRFARGSTRVNRASRAQIERLARSHGDQGGTMLIVEGHASRGGSRRENLRLSQERADAVRRILVDSGADPARIVVVAHGTPRTTDARGTGPRVVIRSTADFPELAREQRDRDVGEDARAARRAPPADRREAPAPTGRTSEGGGTTVVIVPGGTTGAPQRPIEP